MSKLPEPTKQIALDRTSQRIYADLYQVLSPTLQEVRDGTVISSRLIVTVNAFCAALPPLDNDAYKDYLAELFAIAKLLNDAVDVPFSPQTQALAFQLVANDLPRIAAVAICLNQEQAPKFFSTFARDSEDIALEFKTVPEPGSKTQINIQEFNDMLSSCVNRRAFEFEQLVRDDMAQWLLKKGVLDSSGTIPLQGSEPFLIRQGIGVWTVRYEGVDLPPIGRQRGMFYVAYLLTQPPEDTMHAIELEAKSLPLIGRFGGITDVCDPNSPEAVPLGADAVLRERNLSLDLLEDDKFLKSQENQALAVIYKADSSEGEKKSAYETLRAIYEFQKSHFNDGSGPAAASAKRVRTAVDRLITHLQSVDAPDPTAKDAAHDFADHIEEAILNPSRVLWPTGGRASRKSEKRPGHFTCVLPPGIRWVYQ